MPTELTTPSVWRRRNPPPSGGGGSQPSTQNIPTTLLAQSRRVGLAMNRVGSMLTVGQAGLEKLDRAGRAMVTAGDGYATVQCLPALGEDADARFAALGVDRT